MIFIKQGLTVAAYEAAHRAVQPQGNSAVAIATANEIVQQRRIQGARVTINPANITSVPQGQFFTVTVTAPAGANRLLPIPIITTGLITGSATAMKEVPSS